jgi:uncharacterized protein
MIGTLNNAEIVSFLKSNLVGRIGCSDQNRTYVVPISYAYDNGMVYAHTHEGLKLQMMRNNPLVCFEVDDATETGNWKSVIAWGTFEEIKDQVGKEVAMMQLLGRVLPYVSSCTMRLGANWPFTNEDVSRFEGVFFKIQIGEQSGRFEQFELAKSHSSFSPPG